MNLYLELDRMTEPKFAASSVRVLTAEEIAELQAAGAITPPQLIPASHSLRREVFPEDFRGPSSFGRTLNRRNWLS